MSDHSSVRQLLTLAVMSLAVGAIVVQHPVTGQETAAPPATTTKDVQDACSKIRQLSGSHPEKALSMINSLLPLKVSSDVRRFLNSTKINILMHDRKFGEALMVADDKSQIDDDPDYYLCLRSNVLIHDGKFEKALEAANQAVSIAPNRSTGYLYRAESYYQLKNWILSEQALRKAEETEKAPSPDFNMGMAQLYGRLGSFNEQRRLLFKTAERWPKNEHVYLYLGLAAGYQEHKDEALRYFRKACDIAKNPTVSLTASDFCYFVEYDDAALEFADQAVRMAPDSARAFVQKSRVLSRLNRKEEALASATRAVELDPNSIIARQRKIQCLVNIGRAEEAVACAEEALSLDAESIPLQLELASAEFRARRYTKAIERTTQIIKRDPNLSTAYHIRGQCHFELGQNWDAVEDFTLAHISFPGEPAPLYNRATAYMALQMPGNALADANAILRRQPGSSVAYEMRSHALRRLGLSQQADADAEKARELNAIADSKQQ